MENLEKNKDRCSVALTTTFDERTTKALTYFDKMPLAAAYMLAAMTLMVVFVGLLVENYYIAGIGFGVGLVLSIAAFLLLKNKSLKKSKTSAFITNDLVHEYFIGDRIYVSETSKIIKSECVSYDWDAFVSAQEVGDFIFMLTQFNTNIILDKTGITRGSASQLCDIIEEHLGEFFTLDFKKVKK